MSDTVDIIPLEDRERWVSEHRSGGLPSQSWAYAWAMSAWGISPKLAVVRAKGARMLLPFHERTWGDAVDVTSLFGISGASTSPESGAPMDLWREFATARGWVAGYIQLAIGQTQTNLFPTNELTPPYTVYNLDLARDDLSRSGSGDIRRKIRDARAAGTTLVEDRPILAASLKKLYPLTAERVRAARHHHFPDEVLERWALEPSSVVLGAQLGDAIQAACIFLVAGDQAEYHVVATSDRGRTLTSWLISNATERLREIGVKSINLGGGVREGDGICAFKQRLGAEPRARYALRQIYDHSRYGELCSAAQVGTTYWFPAYRSRS